MAMRMTIFEGKKEFFKKQAMAIINPNYVLHVCEIKPFGKAVISKK
jgi:hypothetical protein